MEIIHTFPVHRPDHPEPDTCEVGYLRHGGIRITMYRTTIKGKKQVREAVGHISLPIESSGDLLSVITNIHNDQRTAI